MQKNVNILLHSRYFSCCFCSVQNVRCHITEQRKKKWMQLVLFSSWQLLLSCRYMQMV